MDLHRHHSPLTEIAMNGSSTLHPQDPIVDVEAQTPGVTDAQDKQSTQSPSSDERPPSWPKINQDGAPAAPDADFQSRANKDRFSSKSKSSQNACDLQSIESYGRLASLSLAYYRHDLEQMEKVVEQTGGVINDAQLSHVRQTLKEYCELASVSHCMLINRALLIRRKMLPSKALEK